jgi:hypothetical protein
VRNGQYFPCKQIIAILDLPPLSVSLDWSPVKHTAGTSAERFLAGKRFRQQTRTTCAEIPAPAFEDRGLSRLP